MLCYSNIMADRTPEENLNLCKDCSICCQYITVIINPPSTKKELDRIIWYILHESTVFIEEDGTWKVDLNRKCNALNDDGRCTVYEDRPNLCREYLQDDCEKYGGLDDIIHTFKTKKEFIDYINKTPELKKVFFE